jgi:hypothetical protein
MATKKISELTAGVQPTGGGHTTFEVVQGGANVKLTDDLLATFVRASGSTTTFTPGLTFGGAAVGMTFTSQIGRYLKIGPMVLYYIRLILSAKGSSTGTALITNLPFSAVAGVTWPAPMYITSAATLAGQHLQPIVSTNTILLRYLNGASSGSFTDAFFTNTTDLIVAGFYEV